MTTEFTRYVLNDRLYWNEVCASHDFCERELVPSEVIVQGLYFRLGELPRERGVSRNGRTKELEAGVSAFRTVWLREGHFVPALPPVRSGSGNPVHTLSYLTNLDAPAYLVRGEELVGQVGSDGEPLLVPETCEAHPIPYLKYQLRSPKGETVAALNGQYICPFCYRHHTGTSVMYFDAMCDCGAMFGVRPILAMSETKAPEFIATPVCAVTE